MGKLKLSKPKCKNKPKPLKNIWLVCEPGKHLFPGDSGIPCKRQSEQAAGVPGRIKSVAEP